MTFEDHRLLVNDLHDSVIADGVSRVFPVFLELVHHDGTDSTPPRVPQSPLVVATAAIGFDQIELPVTPSPKYPKKLLPIYLNFWVEGTCVFIQFTR